MHLSLKSGMLLASLLLIFPYPAHAALSVFTCEPEWKALTETIGKGYVNVTSAISPLEDPHQVRARPSLMAAIRKADLVFCTGAGLETGWLPLLLQRAPANVQPGKNGYLMAADYVNRLDIPVKIDRNMGDIHPEGNPHIQLNPYHYFAIAKVLTERLALLDPPHASYYQAQLHAFTIEWDAHIKRWEKEAASLKGMPVIVHHTSWAYLVDWLQLEQVAALEDKPGIPPSIAHLQDMLTTLQSHPAEVILRTTFDDERPSLWLSGKINIPALILPFTVGNHGTTSLVELFDTLISQLNEVHSHAHK